MKIIIKLKVMAAFAVLLATLASCNNPEKQAGNDANSGNADSSTLQKVEVVKPQKRSFTAEVLITGTAAPNQITTLYAMESGMLTQVRKDIGDRVKAGETIAVLTNPAIDHAIAKARAEIAEAEAEIVAVKAENKADKDLFERLQGVYERTPALTTKSELEEAEAAFLTSSAQIKRAEAYLQSAQSELRIAQQRAGFLKVKAPFNGLITQRFVDKGTMVQSGLAESQAQALFELQEINPIRLTVPVPESDAVAIRKGMKVQVSLPELSSELFAAEVSRTSNALDPMSKTMQVEIDLDNAAGKIISGMYAKALLQINSRDNILSLPVLSKVSHKNEDYVLAVVDQKVKRLPVTAGLSNQEYFEVLNEEITSETQVIVKGKSLVKPGQIVEPILK
jgi:RND family efflux transporter MFP subunit